MCHGMWDHSNWITEWGAEVYFNKTKSLLDKSFFLIMREELHYETPLGNGLSPTHF